MNEHDTFKLTQNQQQDALDAYANHSTVALGNHIADTYLRAMYEAFGEELGREIAKATAQALAEHFTAELDLEIVAHIMND